MIFPVALRTVRLFTILVALSKPLFSADESVLSQAYGLGGLNLIVRDNELQEKLALDKNQLEDIKKTLIDKKLVTGIIGDRVAIETRAKQYLSKALTRDQVNLLRMEVVKREFKTPIRVFRASFLTELGMDEEKATEIETTSGIKYRAISDKLDKLRTEAINEAFPPNVQRTIWQFIGKDFILEENGVSWKDIAVVPELNNRRQLALIQITPLPEKLSLSMEQRQRLEELNKVAFLRSAKGMVFGEDEISEKLDGILSQGQRYAIVQCMQQQIFRVDLLMVFRPEVSKRLDLSEEALVEARAELAESKRRIEEIEDMELAQEFKKLLLDIPLPARKVVTDLVNGVWNLN
ncbi:MAG: hypothetical protein NTY15_10280 [Planctomycetota bacterium]|nr:hypothetical protein [Planctomycetota bacterium]